MVMISVRKSHLRSFRVFFFFCCLDSPSSSSCAVLLVGEVAAGAEIWRWAGAEGGGGEWVFCFWSATDPSFCCRRHRVQQECFNTKSMITAHKKTINSKLLSMSVRRFVAPSLPSSFALTHAHGLLITVVLMNTFPAPKLNPVSLRFDTFAAVTGGVAAGS